MGTLDSRIPALSAQYLPLGRELLQEVIRIPADYVDRPADQGGDPSCGLSNHEGPRLEYLKRRIVEIGAVRSADNVWFDEYGNLVWEVEDPTDGIPRSAKRVIYYDGHTDTVKALRDQWQSKIGGGVDCYDGLVDQSRVDWDFLQDELGQIPSENPEENLIFGRGAADQLGGVIAQVIATKIALELADEGALKGVILRAYATTAEEDNDGAGPMYVMQRVLPGASADVVPDVVILTEGTGDSQKGVLGIYRGQRGRMQIQVTVTGRSCHGSMPWEGLNPLEFGAGIIAEAAQRYNTRDGFKDDAFLGHGTRTASWAKLETPSDCAVPDRFTFRFDRRLTVGESPEDAVADVANMASVQHAQQAGLTVDVAVPIYEEPTWKGYKPGNPQVYMGWATPEEHPAIRTAIDAYSRVVGPHIGPHRESVGGFKPDARVDRWIFSTDGVGYPIPAADNSIAHTQAKDWVVAGAYKHPPMFGFGPGIEQNTHKIGECVDQRELQHAISFLARFPSLFAERG